MNGILGFFQIIPSVENHASAHAVIVTAYFAEEKAVRLIIIEQADFSGVIVLKIPAQESCQFVPHCQIINDPLEIFCINKYNSG